jgi:hypothetical protein
MMPTIRVLLALVPAFFFTSALLPDATAFAQGAQNDETDQQFLSRMQSRLNRSMRRTENLETLTRQKMGTTTGSREGIGVESSGTYGTTARNPMSSDLQRMRLELRSLRKKIDKDSERMGEEFRSRDNEEFDRRYWEGYVQRLERDLDEMDRDLRRL